MIMNMKSSSRLLKVSFIWLIGLVMTGILQPQLSAQQIVYKMEFERERGFNDQGFSGGYFVAPITGGQGSFVLTTGRGGSLEVLVINEGAKLYRAVTDKKEVRWVVQAQVGGATAPTQPPLGEDDDGGNDTPIASTGAFLAVGKGDFNATFRTPLITLETAIARELKGEVISASSAALDENFDKVGFVAMSNWRLKWAEKETNEVNRQGLELLGASAYLVGLFERDSDGGGGPPVIIAPPNITTVALPIGFAGVNYVMNEGLRVSGGVPPYTWTAAGLPTGMSLSGNFIVNAATTSGRYPVTLTVRDSQNPARFSSRTLTLDIFINILPNNLVLDNGDSNAPYPPKTFTVQGNVGAVTFSQGAGSNLPAGMTFVDGTLSGTPTQTGNFSLVVSATDAGTTLEATSKTYTFTIQ